MKFFLAFFLFAALLCAAGCGSIADSAPASPASVTNVADYYLPLNSIGASYMYCLKINAVSDTVQMLMQGEAMVDKMRGGKCYSTYMTKANQRIFNYYYTMNDSEAYTLGTSCTGENSTWLDLKIPMTVGQKWTFDNSGGSFYVNNTYTATITRRGATMKMPDGTIFNDVAEVVYTSSGGDSTVKWFAKGVGLIYSTSKNPNSDFGQEMILVGQK
jgi:hypothetical protein